MSNNGSNFTQELILPSQGLLNKELPGGKVVQRCMMVADQKFLSGSNQSAGSAINQLIQRTITAPAEFNVDNLTLPDTLYLLFKLRILSYGDMYKFRTKCPECGKKIEVLLNMAELPVENLSEDYEDAMVAELPHRGDKVYTRMLTNKDIEDINMELKRRKKRSPEDDSEYCLRITKSIEKIELAHPDKDGNKELTSAFDIERYVNALTDLDATTILAARDSAIYGVSPVVEYQCPECGEYIDVSVHFSNEFFRPYTSR